MKKGTNELTATAVAFMASSIIFEGCEIMMGVGLVVFAFLIIYDKKFRRMF